MRRPLTFVIQLSVLSWGCAGPSDGSGPLPRARSPQELIEPPPPPPKLQGALYWGTVKELKGPTIVLALRDNTTLNVDMSEAQKRGRCVIPVIGRNVVANGTMVDGVLRARVVNRAKGAATWGADSRQ
jgi:hypothetical protein